MAALPPNNSNNKLVSVYSGRDCVGHIISRGPQGFEAYDRDDRSLGFFSSQEAAAHALAGAAP
jgi:hypothetical protein